MVAQNDLNAVVHVDPLSGNRTTISGQDFGTDEPIGGGPPLEFPLGIAVDADGNLVIADAASSVRPAGLRAPVRIQVTEGGLSGVPPDVTIAYVPH